MNHLTELVAQLSRTLVWWLGLLVLGYALASAAIQAVVLLAAGTRITRALARETSSSLDDVFAHPATPGVTVVVPAHNEVGGIVHTARSLTALNYPTFEIVIVDDGSDDGTAERLIEDFGLVPSERGPVRDLPVRGEITTVHEQPGGGPVLLVRKSSVGRKADALNAGISFARHPLVCMVDGDSVLERDALLMTIRPLVEDDRIAAVGGVVRPANGLRIERGQVTRVTTPRSWLAKVQIVEYLRAFLLSRVAWTGINGVLIVAGAFGVFRTDLVTAVGGLDLDSVAEDAELVATLHHRIRAGGGRCRVVIVPQPVAWSEVPENLRDLTRQRRRWSAGLVGVLRRHRGAFLRPRYGAFGCVALPYFVVFEVLEPLVEVLGWVIVPLGLTWGVIDLPFTFAYLGASVGLGTALSLGALLAEELAFHQYPRWRDFVALTAAAVLENLGVRQIICLYRLRGTLDGLRSREVSWGEHRRVGLGDPAAGAPAIR